jgi:hypothetical protein
MDFSLLGLWSQMGWSPSSLVITLLIMSMLAITVSIRRLITFRKGRRRSLEYIAALQPLIGTPGRLHEALRLPRAGTTRRWPACSASVCSEYRQGLERLGSAPVDTIEIEVLGHGVATFDGSRQEA